MMSTSLLQALMLGGADRCVWDNAAAAKTGTLVTLSSWATTNIEDVAAAAPEAARWFQLYIYKDRELTAQLVRRAEAAGYKAIALTVDAPILGIRDADVRNSFSLPSHLSLANYALPETARVQASGTLAARRALSACAADWFARRIGSGDLCCNTHRSVAELGRCALAGVLYVSAGCRQGVRVRSCVASTPHARFLTGYHVRRGRRTGARVRRKGYMGVQPRRTPAGRRLGDGARRSVPATRATSSSSSAD
jgi:hypothetical protein